MNYYPYLYKVTVFDSAYDENERFDYGVIMCSTYSAAAHEIEAYYGNELIEMNLYAVEEGPLTLNKEMYEQIKKGDYLNDL